MGSCDRTMTDLLIFNLEIQTNCLASLYYVLVPNLVVTYYFIDNFLIFVVNMCYIMYCYVIIYNIFFIIYISLV